jgi:hypothetical protein
MKYVFFIKLLCNLLGGNWQYQSDHPGKSFLFFEKAFHVFSIDRHRFLCLTDPNGLATTKTNN